VCPDDGTGLPDTTDVLAIDYDISTPQMLSWTTADFGEVEFTQTGDLWVIAKWPEWITEPHIGMEINDPSSERSWRYYFKDGQSHYENMGVPPYYREWYFRLIIAVPPVGVEERPGFQELRDPGLYCQPNPFRDALNIRFQIPQGEEKIDLKIFDITGRVVKRSLDRSRDSSLYSLVVWDGTDDRSNELSAGIYFVQLRTAQRSLTQKAVLLR